MDINGEKFSYSGKKLTDLGFTKVMTWQAITDEETVPNVAKNDQLDLTEVKLQEKQTSPPDYLTEADLITLMEKHGIGTDASIPVHINNICQRNYCTVVAGRKLMPTTLGVVLVHGYLKVQNTHNISTYLLQNFGQFSIIFTDRPRPRPPPHEICRGRTTRLDCSGQS